MHRTIAFALAGAIAVLFRILIAAVVIYLFLVALVIGDAQQHIVAELKDQAGAGGPKLSYSEALERYHDIQRRQRELPALLAQLKRFQDLKLADEAQQDELTADFQARVEEIGAVAEEERPFDCGIPDQIASVPPTQLWERVTDCDLSKAKSAVRSDLDDLKSESPAFLTLQARMNAAKLATVRDTASFTSFSDDVASQQKDLSDPQAVAVTRAFSGAKALHLAWLLLDTSVEDLPPFLIQILLSMFSGMFGAMLVALVILVYPNSDLAPSEGRGYGARVILGGLIAICVYLLLGSGATMLGNNATTDVSSANVMAFCSVGVLAGMFSDRVAQWLSQQANAFFAAPGEASAAGPTATPGPAAPAWSHMDDPANRPREGD